MTLRLGNDASRAEGSIEPLRLWHIAPEIGTAGG
jgi:hypothetical protein